MYSKREMDIITEIMEELMKDEVREKMKEIDEEKETKAYLQEVDEDAESFALVASKLYEKFLEKGFDKNQAFRLTNTVIAGRSIEE